MIAPTDDKLIVKQCLKKCLPEFCHINHYWDAKRQLVIAKILPGELYFTTGRVGIATTLGSCISVCMWDRKINIGGMNHFMLPLTKKEPHLVSWGHTEIGNNASRYGNYAMENLINSIQKNGGSKKNLSTKIFGGAKVFKTMSSVGQQNIEFILEYLHVEKIPIDCEDLGEVFARKLVFEPYSGKAFVKKIKNLHNDTIVRREQDYSRCISNKDDGGEIELF